MLLLAFDTASPAVTVAVLRDGEPVATEEARDARRHGELLAPAVAAVLARAGVRRRDLDAVAVGTGPGPFTGLRVGVMTAAALADALGVPAYGVGSLDALARRHTGGPLVVATDARRREVYWAEYASDGSRVAGPDVGPPAALAELVRGRPVRVAGAGALLYRDAFVGIPLDETDPYPSGAAVGELAWPRAAAGLPAEPLVPLYLRRPDATPPGAPKPVLRR